MGLMKIPTSWGDTKNAISHVKKAHRVVTSMETLDREAGHSAGSLAET